MKRWVMMLAGMAAGVALVAGAAWVARGGLSPAAPPTLHGMLLDSPQPAADFTLTSGAGRAVKLSDFRGKLTILYFGYTFCPDVCPTTLADLAKALQTLGDQAAQVQVVFVSIDPGRDTPERTDAYARAFSPSFVGLSGTVEEVTAAATPLGIFFEKAAGGDAQNYTMNHTATLTVLDRRGYTRLVWPYGVPPADLASDLQYLLK